MRQELQEIKDKRQYAIDILNAKICPYCGNKPTYIDSKEVYGQSYGMIYRCHDCDAHVGVHKGTDKPLGRLANKELRQWKRRVHTVFDPLWQNGKMARQEAYDWLAEQLNISKEFCHIGMFSKRYCKKAIKIIESNGL